MKKKVRLATMFPAAFVVSIVAIATACEIDDLPDDAEIETPTSVAVGELLDEFFGAFDQFVATQEPDEEVGGEVFDTTIGYPVLVLPSELSEEHGFTDREALDDLFAVAYDSFRSDDFRDVDVTFNGFSATVPPIEVASEQGGDSPATGEWIWYEAYIDVEEFDGKSLFMRVENLRFAFEREPGDRYVIRAFELPIHTD